MTARLKLIGTILVGAVLGVLVVDIGVVWVGTLLLSFYTYPSSVSHPEVVLQDAVKQATTMNEILVPILVTGPVLGAVTAWTWFKPGAAGLTCIKWSGLVFFGLVAFHLYFSCYTLTNAASVMVFLLCHPALWWSLLLMRWGDVLNKRSQT